MPDFRPGSGNHLSFKEKMLSIGVAAGGGLFLGVGVYGFYYDFIKPSAELAWSATKNSAEWFGGCLVLAGIAGVIRHSKPNPQEVGESRVHTLAISRIAVGVGAASLVGGLVVDVQNLVSDNDTPTQIIDLPAHVRETEFPVHSIGDPVTVP